MVAAMREATRTAGEPHTDTACDEACDEPTFTAEATHERVRTHTISEQ
jgi:hypothetical protein